MAIWNPWRGCHKKSDGCLHCYIHRGDANKGIDTDVIVKTDGFYRIIERDKKGNYVVKSGQTVYVCFDSDFFIEEADSWREEAWQMMMGRTDLKFFFITKRIERYPIGLPVLDGEQFAQKLGHVSVAISVENQAMAYERVPLLRQSPFLHRTIILQPMLEPIDLSPWLDSKIDLVVVGGESGQEARPLHREWVLAIRRQCLEARVAFEYRQVGTYYVEGDATEKVQTQHLCKRAREEGLDLTF